MLIGWATPFGVRSAIGKFSRFVCDELARRGHQIVIIRTETGPELEMERLSTPFKIVSADAADLDRFDIVIINFGNHAPYHAQGLSLLAARPALSIFHDAQMKDFAWGLANRHGLHLPVLHGDSAEAELNLGLVDSESAPLLGALAAMSWGAIVHGPHYRDVVAHYCPGPVLTVPLCYPDERGKEPERANSSTPKILIFGVITEHKQPVRVMKAISRLREKHGPVELHLAGAIESHYRARLEKEAIDLGIEKPIFHGYVSDDKLTSLLADSSLVCCLRHPVTEGGSASLATALYHQRPLIVSDVASYSMVPDNLVQKVSYGEDASDLAEAISDILENPSLAEARASLARDWANDTFGAAAYADSLLPLLSDSVFPVLASLARTAAPDALDSDRQPIASVIARFAETLDWMRNCCDKEAGRV